MLEALFTVITNHLALPAWCISTQNAPRPPHGHLGLCHSALSCPRVPQWVGSPVYSLIHNRTPERRLAHSCDTQGWPAGGHGTASFSYTCVHSPQQVERPWQRAKGWSTFTAHCVPLPTSQGCLTDSRPSLPTPQPRTLRGAVEGHPTALSPLRLFHLPHLSCASTCLMLALGGPFSIPSTKSLLRRQGSPRTQPTKPAEGNSRSGEEGVLSEGCREAPARTPWL